MLSTMTVSEAVPSVPMAMLPISRSGTLMVIFTDDTSSSRNTSMPGATVCPGSMPFLLTTPEAGAWSRPSANCLRAISSSERAC